MTLRNHSHCLGHLESISVSLQGRLTGLGGEDLPTIVIVAHYDAFGVAPVSTLVQGQERSGAPQKGRGCLAPSWWVMWVAGDPELYTYA